MLKVILISIKLHKKTVAEHVVEEIFSVRKCLTQGSPVFYMCVSSLTFTFYPISICSLKAAGSQPSRTHT